MWNDKLFWFSQPSLDLNVYDNYFLWLFLGLTGIGILLKLGSKFVIKHPVGFKLWNKFSNAALYSGLIGIFWYSLRYENVPFFANRYWAALVVLVFIIWVLFILKFLFRNYSQERSAFDRLQLNSKYIPGPKR
ncbi:MAG: hypothetical protein KW788_04280 [Candidatus Doudnabacteria bacterium]|nr:hypothetical protein [Candidatus Doudnabacteria bacterium]